MGPSRVRGLTRIGWSYREERKVYTIIQYNFPRVTMPERCLFVAKKAVVDWDAFSKPGKDVVNDRRLLSSQSGLCLPSGRFLGRM